MTLVKVNNPIFKSIDGLMKDFLNDLSPTVSRTFREDVLHFPPVNIIEKISSYLVNLSVPGFGKNDFKIQVDKNVLTVSVEQKEEIKDENEKIVRREFNHKSFKRSFTLDDKIDAEKIEAVYENGILSLELPKKEEEKSKTVQVNVK